MATGTTKPGDKAVPAHIKVMGDSSSTSSNSTSPPSSPFMNLEDSPYFMRPSDWPPRDGAIDLNVHDLPHASSNTEWWYLNSHLKTTSIISQPAASVAAASPSLLSRPFSLFCSFFRMAQPDFNASGSSGSVDVDPGYGHALNWAIVDVENRSYHSDSILDYRSPKTIAAGLKRGDWNIDDRLKMALLEVCNQDRVPLPDRLFDGPCRLSRTGRLELDYCGHRFSRDASSGNYHLSLNTPAKKMACELVFVPQKQPVRQGHNGVVKVGVRQETMFYYFIPRCSVSGTLTVNGTSYRVEGNGWYDHEFGHSDAGGKPSTPTTSPSSSPSPSFSPSPFSPSPSSSPSPSTSSINPNSLPSSLSPLPSPTKMDMSPVTPTERTIRSSPSSSQSPIEDKKNSQEPAPKKKDYAWNWASIQLDNGTDITATTLVDPDPKSPTVVDNYAVVIDGKGIRTEYLRMTLAVKNSPHSPTTSSVSSSTSAPVWTSVRTSCEFPTEWTLTIPDAGYELDLVASFPEQEFMTLIARPSFWEGRLEVSGTLGGKPVRGVAFIERQGFQNLQSMDLFFKRISKQVLVEVSSLLPAHPTYEQVRSLMASPQYDHFMNGVNLDVFTKTLIQPLRELVERGGKAWRSFSLLLCIDCVGGYSPRFRRWLAFPEIMHVGSLIVDDIQDKSAVRRGGPSCHVVHGEAIAINAGTAAYFFPLNALLDASITAEMRLKLYDYYLLTLRAGHAGQAFDVYGLDYLMDEVVLSGDSSRLEQSVLCTHRLKSAVPAGNLARMGAVAGGGNHEQSERLGRYFESIGIAFQIIDDVLNCRGFKGDTKARGEDLSVGKITHPVAKAMSSKRLKTQAEREALWSGIKSKTTDQKVLDGLLDILEKCGAVDACVNEASEMVDAAWKEVDQAIPDSFYKVMLRAFGFYVLQRHY